MKIYYTASARGKNEYREEYQKIFDLIRDLGHTNLDDTILDVDQNNLYESSHGEGLKMYEHAMKCIQKADVVILEVSTHSLSMGFVMEKALAIGKPVVALYTKEMKPFFASSIENEKLQVISYKLNDLKQTLSEALDFAQDQSDTRFNFFISPSLSHYLDWVSRTMKIPRSVYLRKLIEDDRGLHSEYSNV